ncbi:MAG: DUF2970 domain-containing protein [Gammaproteobacteria bacterium]|nr:DUF2970 domain-containing protein [Gammaproteobacteria bacterium]
MGPPGPAQQGLSILQVIQSVVAAAMGVQSNRNRERDFTRGAAKTFIIAGLIGTAVFVLTVYTVVHLVLGAAGH